MGKSISLIENDSDLANVRNIKNWRDLISGSNSDKSSLANFPFNKGGYLRPFASPGDVTEWYICPDNIYRVYSEGGNCNNMEEYCFTWNSGSWEVVNDNLVLTLSNQMFCKKKNGENDFSCNTNKLNSKETRKKAEPSDLPDPEWANSEDLYIQGFMFKPFNHVPKYCEKSFSMKEPLEN